MKTLNNTLVNVLSNRFKPLTNKEWNETQKEINKDTNNYFNSLNTLQIVQISFVHYNKTQTFYTTQNIVNQLNKLGYKGLFKTKKLNTKINNCDIQKIEYAITKINKFNPKKVNEGIENLYDISIITDKVRLIK